MTLSFIGSFQSIALLKSRSIKNSQYRTSFQTLNSHNTSSKCIKKHALISMNTPSASVSFSDKNNEDENLKNNQRKRGGKRAFLNAFYKFTRPHTIRGTILGAFAGCVRALMDTRTGILLELIPRAIAGLIALLAANAFIVGINQIYDEDIDKVNKPFLPIASGDLSKKRAWILIALCAILGLSIVYTCFSSLISGLYAIGMLIGVLYSVPPFRWRNNPFLAAISISFARGFLLNFGVYHATLAALGLPFTWSPPIGFLAVFMTIFATVIALSKDLPDIEGDKQFKVNTFATRMGTDKLSNVVTGLLMSDYVFACLFALVAQQGAIRKPVMILGHLVLASVLMYERKRLVTSDNNSIKQFYKGIWRLFYSEYALFLFI
mmetsp:Transcript_13601/g.24392  ORF Transcript_13601/g.24392 Transcript_13601/m.24392 type:complete len:378 (+) Transcript_13601:55-1188(+)